MISAFENRVRVPVADLRDEVERLDEGDIPRSVADIRRQIEDRGGVSSDN